MVTIFLSFAFNADSKRKRFNAVKPVFEMDDDEMACIIWQFIKDNVGEVEFYVRIFSCQNVHLFTFIVFSNDHVECLYYDLGLQYRDITINHETIDSALAVLKPIVGTPTIMC